MNQQAIVLVTSINYLSGILFTKVEFGIWSSLSHLGGERPPASPRSPLLTNNAQFVACGCDRCAKRNTQRELETLAVILERVWCAETSLKIR